MGHRATRIPLKSARVRRNYGISLHTLENFEYLLKTGKYNSETEIIEFAVERLATEIRTKEKIKKEVPLQIEEDSLG